MEIKKKKRVGHCADLDESRGRRDAGIIIRLAGVLEASSEVMTDEHSSATNKGSGEGGALHRGVTALVRDVGGVEAETRGDDVRLDAAVERGALMEA